MFMTRLEELASEKNVKLAELGRIIDIPSSTIYGWRNGSQPTADKLKKLADYFEVSTDYLLGRSDDSGIVSVSSNLTEFEDGALTLLRKLTKVQQYQVVGYIQALLSA